MEACATKPEVKKRPKPMKRSDPERLEKPTPAVPTRPTDASSGENGRSEAAEVPEGEADVKQGTQSVLTGMFRRSQREKTPTFTSYVLDDSDEEERSGDGPARQAPGSKPVVLKGLARGLRFKSSPKASSDPSPGPSTEEEVSDKGESTEKSKTAEPKQERGGGLLAGMFRKTPKERSLSPALAVGRGDGDPEDTGGEEKSPEQSQEKGGFFSGVLKKSHKTADGTPAQEDPSAHSQLSASSDSLSENNGGKEKGGIFSGMFKKSPKPTDAAQTDEDQRPLHDDLSGSGDNLSENSKEKGGFFGGILRKSPRIPGDGAPGKDKESLRAEPAASNERLPENSNNAKVREEKGGVFNGMFKKSPKLSEGPRLEEASASLHGDRSAGVESLSENKEKGGLFSGLLRKTPKTTGEENLAAQKALSASSESLPEAANTKEKGGAFSGIFKKSSRLADGPATEEEKQMRGDELTPGSEGLSENNTKEKGGIFSGIFKKLPKPAEAAQPEEDECPDNEFSASTENSSENTQEKGVGLFSGLLKKTPKASGERTESPDREAQNELSANGDDPSENNTTKEKNIFSHMFKKPQKPAEGAAADKEQEVNSKNPLAGSCENLTDTTVLKEKRGGLAGIFKRSASIDNLFEEEKGGLFSGLLKKTPKVSGDEAAAEDKDEQRALSASNDSLSENASTKERSIFSGMFKKTPKPAEATTDEEPNTGEDKKLYASWENLLEVNTSKEKTGGLAGIFKKSPKPAPRSVATKDPLSDTKELSASWDSLTDAAEAHDQLSVSNDNLSEATSKEKKVGFAGMFRRTPKTLEQQESEDMEAPEGGGLRRRRTIKKKRRVVSFRIKRTLPKVPKVDLSSQTPDKMPVIEETVELQELSPAQESTVEVQTVEMAAYPTEDNPLQPEQESDELMEWWNTVKGWTEWNETSNFREEDEEMAMEQAADRVYMAARVFVRLFNQRGATLQHHILELLALADAADQFHRKTVTAAVGGGVASVAGSVATITGLILAPFTFGASIIVTAVGISVATAGSITSATANITDTVHSNMDRKKVEKMIQGYQEEIKDIRECLEFVQEGMDTLQEWDFEKFSQSAAKKALNHNIKHVVKEGGRAGKALMINTDKLISTVQVLGAAGGAVKAAQAITVTTGVMSALFLALDVFFLAKDSHELRKGAKTKFATKIREVCKDLQDGLLELNKVKTQLQKTMDGIEVEEYEEIEEVEVEVEDDLESDPKKLAELEEELDLLEEKLDKKAEEEQKKSKEMEKESLKSKEKKEEKSSKEKGDPKEKEEKEENGENDAKKEGKKENKEKGEGESKPESNLVKLADEEKEQKNEKIGKAAKAEVLQEQSQKGSKKDKETENRITAGKDKYEKEPDKAKEDTGTNKKTNEKQKQVAVKEKEEIESKWGHSKQDDWSGKQSSERVKTERVSQRSKSSREAETGIKHEWKSANKEREEQSGSMRGHCSRSDQLGERGSKHETRETGKERGSSSRDVERLTGKESDRTEEQRGVKDWRAEMTKRREEKREGKEGRKEESKRETKQEDHGRSHARKEPHRNHETATRREREWGRGTAPHDEKRGSRVESARRQFERAGGEEVEEEERRKKREDGESRRRDRDRRESDRDREREHSRRGSRPRSNGLLEDGLYI
ncbi:uncharacterized protein LOC120799021 isoform X5 [Xiphias gladius]|uniref:uncharacterized protein LOC120799021 isoform X5 n=1 Tax=Xiphias gladius TaxID=8245 RepID=UPI001A9873F9|nr:uncharacterized protein LOC120799021 isoform X5 [Xiphias gladius]